MLIFDSRHGRFGTQKPRQWGALSAVQSSVRRNAESIGIDLLACIPCWEGAGKPGEIITSEKLSGDDVAWGTGLITSVDTDNPTMPLSYAGIKSLSIFVRATPTSVGSQTGLIDTKRNTDWSSGNGFVVKFGDDQYAFNVGSSQTYHGGPGLITVNQAYNINCEWEKAIRQGFILNGHEVSYTANNVYASNLTEASDLMLGSYYGNSAGYQFCGSFEIVVVAVSGSGVLNDAPYLLLQPNPAPVYFDFGGGGGSITSDLQVLFDVFNSVDSDLNIKFSILNTVSSELNIPYSVLNSVISDVQVVYDIRESVEADLEIRFDMGNAVASDTQIVYDIAEFVFSDFKMRYDLGDIVVSGQVNNKLKIGLGIGF